ncbi:TPM domain-containing protein [Streptomyces sp. NPDC050433]|uniref:TPM domain-containing protein n=1 Tax=Streptomyces sp. NPDC050433 TaxID=3365615 RepID=UPI0037B34259
MSALSPVAGADARAEDPLTLSRQGQITDKVGALEDRESAVNASPDRLYAYSVASAAPLTEGGQTEEARTAASSNTSGSALVLPVALVGCAAALAAYSSVKRKHRASTRTTPKDGPEGRHGPGESPRTPLPELDRRAGLALVDTDDAVRTSQEELGFATAQFGEGATRPFQDTVTYAKGELATAFRLRRQLDDANPADDRTRRRTLDEIIARCTDANSRLDAESAAFGRLRAGGRDAPEALAAAEAAFRELTGRNVTAAATLAAMRERYAGSASAPVGSAVEQADDRLVFAAKNLDDARRAIGAGDNGRAAVRVRAVESAVGQATTLVEGVERRALELAEAAGRLPGALMDTETDLADARGLLEDTAEGTEEGTEERTAESTAESTATADLEGRIARAEAVVADVRQEQSAGPYDPIDALRRVEEADAVLDEALAGAREREVREGRARALLDHALLGARSAVGAAADYISTRRGAVGGEARTRLAEGQRRLDQAGTLTELGDTRGALAEAQHADGLARQAQSLAEQDVRSLGHRSGPGGLFGGGGTRG